MSNNKPNKNKIEKQKQKLKQYLIKQGIQTDLSDEQLKPEKQNDK